MDVDRDILIIGAGVLGLSSAYYLKRRNPNKRILVIDQYGGPGQGNTAKSAGGYRNVFASETNYLLADSTINWFKHLQYNLGHDLKLTRIGYLWLLNEHRYGLLKACFDKMRGMGVELRTIDRKELGRLIPELAIDFEGDEEADIMGLEPVDVGVLGVKCGTVNTDALARCYESLFIKLGGEVEYGASATGLLLKPKEELDIPGEPFIWQEKHVAGAATSRGEIRAETTVVAAGVWSERLLDPIGFDALMRPKKRVMFVFHDPSLRGLMYVEGLNDHGVLPLTHIPELKIYIKPELTEGSLWMACADDFGRRFSLEDDPQPEAELYTDNIYPALVKYFRCFRDVRPVNMWAGQRAINSHDTIPIVAPLPGMIYVGAATGNGILKSDALGRIVSALYAGEEEAMLYGGRPFRVADLGVHARNVELETFRV